MQTGGVADSGALEEFDSVWSCDEELSHMADVEEGGAGAAVQVFLDDAFAGVLHGEVVAWMETGVPAKSTSLPWCWRWRLRRQVSLGVAVEKRWRVRSSNMIRQLINYYQSLRSGGVLLAFLAFAGLGVVGLGLGVAHLGRNGVEVSA